MTKPDHVHYDVSIDERLSSRALKEEEVQKELVTVH